MFCPRCGRAVSEKANFCGGCGLSRAEIERYIQQTQPVQTVSEAPKSDEVKSEVPFGTIVNEPVKTAPAVQPENTAQPQIESVEDVPETVSETVAEMVDEKAETVQPEEVKADIPPVKEEPKAAYTPPVPPQPQPDCSYNAQYAYSSQQYAQQQPAPAPVKNENLSTVDFIWMFIISGIPFVGFIYLIYLAVQNNNTNKRSYARATLLVALFSVIVAVVFAIGIIAAGII